MINLPLQSLQADITTTMTEMTHQAKKFAGRLWTSIQSLPVYMQDRRVACSSLIVVTLIAVEIAKLITTIMHKIVDNYLNETVSDLMHLTLGAGTIFVLTWQFAQKAQLPLKREVSLAIVLITCFVRVVLFSRKENKIEKLQNKIEEK